MTRRVCYLARADRGDRIAAVRLVGQETGEVWLAPAPAEGGGADAASVIETVRGAAAWVAERLREGRWLDVVCLDGEGGVCSWLTAPSAEASVVEAAFAQGGGGALATGSGEGSSGGGVLVQALAEREAARGKPPKRAKGEPEAAGQRLAVLAVQDASARLFLDALDDLGVGVGVVESLWHVLSEAWDRSAPDSGPKADRVVATEAPVVAVVLADPIGRLAWAWSRSGRTLTGGSLRLASHREEGNGNGRPSVAGAEIGRLTADWLAWAAQLGIAPARIVCIVPELAEGGMTAAQMGEAIGRAWPTATVDMVVHDDPVGATLSRLAREGEDRSVEGEGLEKLTLRPGRAHRRMHLWTAVALTAMAAGLGTLAARLGKAAGQLQEQRRTVEATLHQSIIEAAPDLKDNPLPERALLGKIERLRGPGADATGAAKPVLAELQSVVGLLVDFKDAGVEPLEIYLDENTVSKVDVMIPSSAVGEELLRSAKAMPSMLSWSGKFSNLSAGADSKQRYSLTAIWPKAAPGGGR